MEIDGICIHRYLWKGKPAALGEDSALRHGWIVDFEAGE